ncbi:hypothetical protein AD006_30075 (plasmid) [Pseudonocardia sp. EC080610-09]|nr:hypothetical protein AD006_30075 [Pseudonocardia sp. EC080610-09]ALL85555.1 hypothetical protein AD017_31175 [Pseudonocardia sp. EC080619-01]
MIAACPTRGWPHGLHGRRDAFLVVLTVALALPYSAARDLTPAAVVVDTTTDLPMGGDVDEVVTIAGQAVPTAADPRACPACAVVRWLDILGTLDGLGRGSARMDLVAAHAPTTDAPHTHQTRGSRRWRAAATLLPAVDQHGWLDDYRPITARTIRARLARAAARSTHYVAEEMALPKPAGILSTSPDAKPLPTITTPALDQVLAVLDSVSDDADALNARIQALLDGR